MNWKKAMWGFLLIAMIVFLAACSNESGTTEEGEGDTSSEGSSGEEDAAAGEEEEVTIVYARGTDTTPATEEVIKAFEEAHPNKIGRAHV